MPWRVVIPRRAIFGEPGAADTKEWCLANIGANVVRDEGYRWRGPCSIFGRLAKQYEPWQYELWWFRSQDSAVMFDMVWG